jgi:glycine hydroxymethyltransferase
MNDPTQDSNLARFVSAAVERLGKADPELFSILDNEYRRQANVLTMVASASIADPSALICEAMTPMNVTAEGYPGRRFHAGCRHIDEIERLAIHRVKKVFKAQFANVQPMTASSANEIVMFSTMQPGDTLLGLDLDAGGHLSHGSKVSISGQVFNSVGYGLDKNERIDYEQARQLTLKHRPRLIICGTTAYSRELDWVRFRQMADEVGAYVLADITHTAGLVAAGIHSNPIDHAHFTTTCTHKQLYGGRGGLIMIGKDHDQPSHEFPDRTLAEVIQNRVFPYFQGAPNESAIAAKARGMGFVGSDEFKQVARRIVELSRALASAFIEKGYRVITGGTDNHIVVVDVMQKGITGANAEKALEDCGIVVNKNRIPHDAKPPLVTSGIRLGTNGIAIREMEASDMVACVDVIHDILSHLEQSGDLEYRVDPAAVSRAKAEVARLCALRPIRTYPPVRD